eukprot:SAG31_NODE_522_length_14623_cov_6.071674_10_plen_40_part_00
MAGAFALRDKLVPSRWSESLQMKQHDTDYLDQQAIATSD